MKVRELIAQLQQLDLEREITVLSIEEAYAPGPENLPQEPEGPVWVRRPRSRYRHAVPGGRDSMGMPWLYQTAYCGASPGEYAWHTPDSFGWHPDALPRCPKCLARTERR